MAKKEKSPEEAQPKPVKTASDGGGFLITFLSILLALDASEPIPQKRTGNMEKKRNDSE